MDHQQQQEAGPRKKPYRKPQIIEVPLRPSEAVLGFCKSVNSTGPGGAGTCSPAGGACSSFGS